MSTTLTQRRTRQLLLLFGERLAVPHWSDLAETTRIEAVRTLAQLLRSVHAGKPSRALRSRRGRDE
jgi:hypothetical protein